MDDVEISMVFKTTTPKLPPGVLLGPGAAGHGDMNSAISQLNQAFGKQHTRPHNGNANVVNAGGFNGSRKKTLTIKEAIDRVWEEEIEYLVEDDEVVLKRSIENAEQNGIIFLDEIDKLAHPENNPAASTTTHKGEGVQKELLGLIEGCSISTQYGRVNTDHVLFIASGSFHHAKPSDLLPELQGRLPIRVTLDHLTAKDFVKILSETQCNLLEQQQFLLGTEGVEVEFTPEAVEEIAHFAEAVNANLENIGARRLHTIVSKVMENINFTAHQLSGQLKIIDKKYVQRQLADITRDQDLSKYIL